MNAVHGIDPTLVTLRLILSIASWLGSSHGLIAGATPSGHHAH
jgi:hypothetical protein